MSLEGLSDEEIQVYKTKLLTLLRSWGGSAGNISLLRSLGWEGPLYWSIRDRMVDNGHVTLGRGRGGSVHIVEDVGPDESGSAESAPVREEDLYEPMREVLRSDWVRDQRFGSSLVEVTARQGRRDTGGTWTRPDMVVVSYTTLLYVPGKHFDVTTFEIKPLSGLDVTAVYEALAHCRAATRAYVLVHVPDGDLQDDHVSSLIDRVEDEARRHGIGLIVAGSPGDYETWDEYVSARYNEPSPHALNEFLSRQLSDGAKQELMTWFRA